MVNLVSLILNSKQLVIENWIFAEISAFIFNKHLVV